MSEDDSEKLMTMKDYNKAARQAAIKTIRWKMKDCTKHPEKYFIIIVRSRKGKKPNYKYYNQISLFSKSWMPANMIGMMNECQKKGMKPVEARKILQNAEDIYETFKYHEYDDEEIEKKLKAQFPIESWFAYPKITFNLIIEERNLLKNNSRLGHGKKITVPVNKILIEGMDAPEEQKDGSIATTQSFHNRCMNYFYLRGQRFQGLGKQKFTRTDRHGKKKVIERIVAYARMDLDEWSKLKIPLIVKYQKKKPAKGKP